MIYLRRKKTPKILLIYPMNATRRVPILRVASAWNRPRLQEAAAAGPRGAGGQARAVQCRARLHALAVERSRLYDQDQDQARRIEDQAFEMRTLVVEPKKPYKKAIINYGKLLLTMFQMRKWQSWRSNFIILIWPQILSLIQFFHFLQMKESMTMTMNNELVPFSLTVNLWNS